MHRPARNASRRRVGAGSHHMNKGRCLENPPSIDGSFGGSQMWVSEKLMQECGCGIIAGLDAVLRYEGLAELSREEYLKRFDEAARYIRPIVLSRDPEKPKSFGVSTAGFKRGIRKYAASRGLGIRAKGFIFDYENKVRQYLSLVCPLPRLSRLP